MSWKLLYREKKKKKLKKKDKRKGGTKWEEEFGKSMVVAQW